ncbi:putative rmlC-like jelly roll protein [Helianthus anomalus]
MMIERRCVWLLIYYRVFQKYNDRSELFNGIEKYRLAFLEAEPQTFVIPNHWDADVLFYVANDIDFSLVRFDIICRSGNDYSDRRRFAAKP